MCRTQVRHHYIFLHALSIASLYTKTSRIFPWGYLCLCRSTVSIIIAGWCVIRV